MKKDFCAKGFRHNYFILKENLTLGQFAIEDNYSLGKEGLVPCAGAISYK